MDKIGPIYTECVRSKLQKQGVEVFEVQLPDGEEYKTMENLMKIVDCAIENKLDRKRTMTALGAFYQPDAVVIDTQTLDTLPTREYISGISEVIKYGLIRDTVFFEWLEADMPP